MEEKIALPPFWGTFGGNGGPGKIISPVAGSAGACTTRLFLLDHRTTCTVFPVFAMFAMTTMADSCTLTLYPRLQALRPVEHIFIAFRTFDFLEKHISVQQNLMINS